MFRQIIKAMRRMAVVLGFIGACIPSYSQAGMTNVQLKISEGWKTTGIQVKAGDTVSVKANRILRLQDGMSVNSNGEWLFCWNTAWFKRAFAALTAAPRPVPAAPGGALIFRIGDGTPFFVPRTGGTPGKDYTPELTKPGWRELVPGTRAAKAWEKSELDSKHMGWVKLPGYSGSLVHQFVAQESGLLYVNINLSETAKRAPWNWIDFALSIMGKKATECQVTGKLVDEAGKALPEAELQIGTEKKLSAADGSYTFLLSKDGKYSLSAGKGGYVSVLKAFDVSLDKADVLNLGVMMLRYKPAIISGKVLAEDGKIVASALVKIGFYQVMTDKNGAFSAKVNKGIYEVKATKTLPSGMVASGVKENVEVLPGQATDVGSIAIAPTIRGSAGWMATARVIQKGQTIVVKAGGEISKDPFRFGPGGTQGKSGGFGSVLPGEAWGALVAKIGAGKPFLVGADKRFLADGAGVLYFAVNLSPADSKGLIGTFTFKELTVLDLGNLEGTVLGTNGKPLTMATVEVSGIEGTEYTDADGKFRLTDVTANKYYSITIKFPGYNPYVRGLTLLRGQTASTGKVTLRSAPVTGTIAIKMLPKNGTTGGLIPVFVEATNTSVRNGLWGGYLVSLKARASISGKEYPGMSPTYLVLAPGEKRGTELMCQLPASAPVGVYTITAELRVPETISVQDATKQFDAKKELEDKLSVMKEVKGRLVSQNAKTLNVVTGVENSSLSNAAKLLLPTITPKVFSPSKGQVVTGNIALREKSVIVMGKEIEIFKDKNGEPLLIWNYYEGLYLSEREDGTRKDDWISIGQSNVKSDDFTVYWDTSKFKDGDYQIKATMKTTYDGRPIEGSMTLMVKVRNDPRTGRINGTVTDEAGHPLYGVAVKRLARGQTISGMDWNTLGTKSDVEWQAEDVVVTNSRGAYVFNGVLSGDAKLQFSLDKYSQAVKDISLKAGQALTVPAFALEADKCKLDGTVRLDDGAIAAGVTVSLAGPSALSASVGGDGKYSFDGAKKGAYRAFVSKDEYDSAFVDFTCAPGEAKSVPGLLLKRKLYSLTGMVKDEAGRPLADVSAALDKSVAGTKTDQNGKFSIWNFPGGSHALSFVKARYETADRQFETLKSTGLVQVDVVMKQSKGTLTGTVNPADAQVLIDGAAVQVAGGKYEATLAVGEHAISASKDGYYAAEQKAAVLSGQATVADIKLTQIPPLVLVSPQGGEALTAGSALEIKWTGGNPSWPIYISIVNGAGTQAIKAIVETTPNNGSYNWTVDMPAGSYLIYVQGNRGNASSGWVYGKPFTVALPKGTLSGTLIPAAAQLFIDGNEIALQGNKYEAALAPGEHTVQALKDRFDTFDGKVIIKSGETTTLDIKLNEGYGKDGYNKDGYDKTGYDKDGYDLNGFNKEGYDKAGFNKEGYDKAGFDKDGYDKAGFNKEGYDRDGFNKEGFDKAGYNKEGYDKAGFNKEGYDKAGFNKDGYDKAGFNKDGYDKDGYDRAGFSKEGYDRNGFNKEGYDRNGFNQAGYDKDGYNKAGYDKDGYNKAGYDKDGYNRSGYDKDGYNKSGYDKDGYNKAGFNQDGYDRNGYNLAGYDKDGYNKAGYDKDGYNKAGYDKDGYNKLGYDQAGYNKAGYDKDGYNKSGYDKDGYNKSGYDKDGYNKLGYDQAGYNKAGYDKDGYNKSGYDKDGYNKAGFNKDGYDRNGYNLAGYDKDGYNRSGYDKDGYNKSGYDKDGYNKAGFNKDGYDRNGYNQPGYDNDG
ncbi:MAG: carboxypeptidase regulatory-like domain-containing protein [Elusimicrobiota bacterium]|nr:carboxypeptidase regulatory-like domain-containing protein [Elusimicrobiota bacterium]